MLDIGSGSGLLAMMAARAAAENNRPTEQIVSVEAVESIAQVAEAVISRNGFAELFRYLGDVGGQAQRSRKKIHTIRVYPKMWAPIAGKVGASAAEK